MGRNFSFIVGVVILAFAAGAPVTIASSAPLIAPPAACLGQTSTSASPSTQERTMRCMAAFARDEAELEELALAEALSQSARRKSRDVIRCGDFSHFACGRDFTYWMKKTGYISSPRWHVGENLAWGVGEQGTVRSIFLAWMRSPSHRENVLGDFDQIGIGLRTGAFAGSPKARVWTQHFGSSYSQAQ